MAEKRASTRRSASRTNPRAAPHSHIARLFILAGMEVFF